MAIGDDAAAAGYPLVPNSGPDGQVRDGARELNRTRDLIAQLAAKVVNVWPIDNGGTGAITKAGARTNLGITSGTAVPANANGQDGDIYFRIV